MQGFAFAAPSSILMRSIAIAERAAGLKQPRSGLGLHLSRHCDPWTKQFTLVDKVLARDASRDGLQTLKASGRFEMRALLAAVQRRIAFRAIRFEIDTRGQRGGAVEAPGRRHGLHQAREAGACDVDGGPWPLLAWLLLLLLRITAPVLRVAGLVVATLSILTISVHEFEKHSLSRTFAKSGSCTMIGRAVSIGKGNQRDVLLPVGHTFCSGMWRQLGLSWNYPVSASLHRRPRPPLFLRRNPGLPDLPPFTGGSPDCGSITLADTCHEARFGPPTVYPKNKARETTTLTFCFRGGKRGISVMSRNR
jgi:hypothetical protein